MRTAWQAWFLVLPAGLAVAAEGPAGPAGASLTGRLIVKARVNGAGVVGGVGGVGRALAAVGAGVVERAYPEVSEWVVRVPAGETEATYAAKVMATGLFAYAHPDWLVAPAAVPNDPMYGSQWHLPRMGLPSAWEVTTGVPAVVVAFCDSGVDLGHPDLAGVLVPGYNSVDNLAQASGGDVSGLNDHGTEVAGCIGAVGNNGVGVAGMGWNLRLMPVRVTNLVSGNATLSEINEGARWAADHGAKVVNISYTGVSAPTNATTGVYLRERGASCVWAAGNASGSAGPLDIPELVVVGATDQADALASFSNFGPAVDVAAPGVGIWTTRIGGYAAPNGTSFAAPLTAGALALARSANASWGPVQAELALVRTARDLGPAGRDDTFGAGLVDAGALAALARDAMTVPMAPVATADRVVMVSGATVDVDVLANDGDLNGGALALAWADPGFAGGWAEVVRGAGGRDVVRVTADGAFRGSGTLSYGVRDEGGLVGVGTIEVRVSPPAVWGTPTAYGAAGYAGQVHRIRAVDLDQDGDLDLALGTSSAVGAVVFLRNVGGAMVAAGSFDTASGGDLFDLVDLNGDGRPDLVVGSATSGGLVVALATGPFGFGAPTFISTGVMGDLVATREEGGPIDVNGDGFADVVSTTTSPARVEVRLGNGAGALSGPRTTVVSISPVVVRAAEVTGDGLVDVLVGSTGTQTLSVLAGTSSGVLASARATAIGVDPRDVRVGDFRGTGEREIAVLSAGLLGQSAGLTVLRRTGGEFAVSGRVAAEGDTPWMMASSDLNRDGCADVAVVNMLPLTRSMYPGGRSGLEAGLGPAASTLPLLQSVAAADVSGDGVPDLVSGGWVLSGFNLVTGVEVLVNRTPRQCVADFNGDGFADFFDYDAFVSCFEGSGCPAARRADVNFDGFVDFFDYLDFVGVFERGC